MGPIQDCYLHMKHALWDFYRSMEKIAWDGPKWGREGFFPANPDLAGILGDMDLDVENCHVF